METGEIEVEIESLDILNRAENLPFQINEKSTLVIIINSNLNSNSNQIFKNNLNSKFSRMKVSD